MRTTLTVAAAAVAALFATSLVVASAQATPLPVLKSDISQSDVTLVGRGGGRGGGGGGGGRGGFSRGGGGGGGHALRGGGGGGRYAYRGGGGGGRMRIAAAVAAGPTPTKAAASTTATRAASTTVTKTTAGNYNRYKNYGHYNNYRRFYGWPYIAYGYGYGGCGWLYRNAVATGDAYWWNRYYNCTGYY